MADKQSPADDEKCRILDSIEDLKRRINLIKQTEENLQNERDNLLLEKSKLQPLNLESDEEILKNVSHVISEDKGREILKLLKEIHNYELEILEENSKLEEEKINREISELKDAIYLATTPPHTTNSSNLTNLHKWYQQLKTLHPKDFDGVVIHNVYFKRIKTQVKMTKEELKFALSYCGSTLHMSVESNSQLITHEDGKDLWDVTDCSITSDIVSTEVSGRGEHLLKFGRPVRMFIQEIIDFMTTSLVAYI